MLVKNRKFNQKSKFWPKNESLVNNFSQKSKFWLNIESLVENLNFGKKNPNFGQK